MGGERGWQRGERGWERKSKDASFHFLSAVPSRSLPPPPVLGSISKAAGALSSTTDKLGGKAEAFPFLFFPFLRWPANVILHTRNGLAVSSTNFRGDNLTFTPPSLPPPSTLTLSLSLFLSLPPSLYFSPGILSEGQVEEAVDSNRMWRGEGLS